jgi:hypothetical protein
MVIGPGKTSLHPQPKSMDDGMEQIRGMSLNKSSVFLPAVSKGNKIPSHNVGNQDIPLQKDESPVSKSSFCSSCAAP